MVAFNKILYGFNEGAQAQTLVVDIMWGLQGINKTKVDHFNASDIGTADWDNDFDLSPPENQQAAFDFCQHLKKQEDLLYLNNSLECWIDDFKAYLISNGNSFPLQKGQFYTHFFNFISNTKQGKYYRTQNHIGVIDKKLVYMKYVVKAAGGLYDPYYLKSKVW